MGMQHDVVPSHVLVYGRRCSVRRRCPTIKLISDDHPLFSSGINTYSSAYHNVVLLFASAAFRLQLVYRALLQFATPFLDDSIIGASKARVSHLAASLQLKA